MHDDAGRRPLRPPLGRTRHLEPEVAPSLPGHPSLACVSFVALEPVACDSGLASVSPHHHHPEQARPGLGVGLQVQTDRCGIKRRPARGESRGREGEGRRCMQPLAGKGALAAATRTDSVSRKGTGSGSGSVQREAGRARILGRPLGPGCASARPRALAGLGPSRGGLGQPRPAASRARPPGLVLAPRHLVGVGPRALGHVHLAARQAGVRVGLARIDGAVELALRRQQKEGGTSVREWLAHEVHCRRGRAASKACGARERSSSTQATQASRPTGPHSLHPVLIKDVVPMCP